MLTFDKSVNKEYNGVTMEKEYLSTSEVAKILGISRIAVFKKIKSGEIKAEKKGRNNDKIYGKVERDTPVIYNKTNE